MTTCPGWFYGGPHTWPDRGTAPCPVKRRQKPPYQHKWTAYHEWKDDVCVHCKKTREQVKRPQRMTAKCTGCGLTRYEVKRLKELGLQLRLSVDMYREPTVAIPPPVIRGRKPKLRLVTNHPSGAGPACPGSATKST